MKRMSNVYLMSIGKSERDVEVLLEIEYTDSDRMNPVDLISSYSDLIIDLKTHRLERFQINKILPLVGTLRDLLYYNDTHVSEEDRSKVKKLYRKLLCFLHYDDHPNKTLYLFSIDGSIDDEEQVITSFNRLIKDYNSNNNTNEGVMRIVNIISNSISNSTREFYSDVPFLIDVVGNTINLIEPCGSYSINVYKRNNI